MSKKQETPVTPAVSTNQERLAALAAKTSATPGVHLVEKLIKAEDFIIHKYTTKELVTNAYIYSKTALLSKDLSAIEKARTALVGKQVTKAEREEANADGEDIWATRYLASAMCNYVKKNGPVKLAIEMTDDNGEVLAEPVEAATVEFTATGHKCTIGGVAFDLRGGSIMLKDSANNVKRDANAKARNKQGKVSALTNAEVNI